MSELRPIKRADVRGDGESQHKRINSGPAPCWRRQNGIVGVWTGATGAGEGQSEQTRQRSKTEKLYTGEGAW